MKCAHCLEVKDPEEFAPIFRHYNRLHVEVRSYVDGHPEAKVCRQCAHGAVNFGVPD